MATFTLQGFSITFEEEAPVSVAPSELLVAVSTAQDGFRYTIAFEVADDLPQVDFVNFAPHAAGIGGIPLSPVMQTSIGRIERAEGTSDIAIVFDPRTETAHVFRLGGAEITPPESVSEAVALLSSITSRGPVPGGEPLAPGATIAFADIPGIATDGSAQVIRLGNVSERPSDGVHEIGVGPAPADGSVSVVHGASYVLQSSVPGSNSVTFGADGSRGDLVVAGSFSSVDIVTPEGPDSPTDVTFGAAFGHATLRVLEDSLFNISPPSGPDGGRHEVVLNFASGSFATAELLVSDSVLRVRDMSRAEIVLGDNGGSAFGLVTDDGLLSMAASEGSRLRLGDIGTSRGELYFTNGGSGILHGLEALEIGIRGGTGLLGIDGPGTFVLADPLNASVDRLTVTLGSPSGSGEIRITGGGDMMFRNAQNLDVDFAMHIAAGGLLSLTDGASMSVGGFRSADFVVDDMGARGSAELYMVGGTLTLATGAGAPAPTVVVGREGSGAMTILNGAVVDLGGGSINIGGWGDDDAGTRADGSVTLDNGAMIQNFETAWIGIDPSLAPVDVPPDGGGSLKLYFLSDFGDHNSTTHLGLLGDIEARNGTLRGDLVLAGGRIRVDQSAPKLSVDGNLIVSEHGGVLWLRPNSMATNWSIDIEGALRLDAGTFEVRVNPQQFASFQAGTRLEIFAASEIMRGDGQLVVNVGQSSGPYPGFSYLAGAEAAAPGVLFVEALNSQTAGGTAVLDLEGGAGAAVVGVVSEGTRVGFEGGRFLFGEAVRPDEIVATAFDDVIDLSGYLHDIVITGGAGNDTIIGGSGFTVARYSGNIGDYVIETDVTTGITIVTDTRGIADNDGTDTLSRVNLLSFKDEDLALPDAPAQMGVTVTVSSRWGTPMEGVTVAVLPTTGEGQNAPTDATGAVEFILDAGAAGSLGASLTWTSGAPSITSEMVTEALRLSVGLLPTWGVARPEDFLAADLDGSGTVDSTDVLQLLRTAVGLVAEHVPRWVFIDSEADLTLVSRTNASLPEGIEFAALGGDAAFGMTGILVGHMVETA